VISNRFADSRATCGEGSVQLRIKKKQGKNTCREGSVQLRIKVIKKPSASCNARVDKLHAKMHHLESFVKIE
jgi:hypothetical protein